MRRQAEAGLRDREADERKPMGTRSRWYPSAADAPRSVQEALRRAFDHIYASLELAENLRLEVMEKIGAAQENWNEKLTQSKLEIAALAQHPVESIAVDQQVDPDNPALIDAAGRIAATTRLPMANAQGTVNTSPSTAADAGATATITIAAHTRQMPSGGIPYNSGSITGLAFSTKYYVYADDPNFAGGAVTYNATTSRETTVADEGRYLVGSITTPADGGGGTGGDAPPCTLRGTKLITEFGPMNNEEIFERWASGETVRLETNIGTFEKIVRCEWVRIEVFIRVKIEGFTTFGCSREHNFKRQGERMVKAEELGIGNLVWTRSLWQPVIAIETVNESAEVLRLELEGPQHTYLVEEGVWTHNLKLP